MPELNYIKIDGNNELFNKMNMFYKELKSDIKLVRFYTLLILQKAPVRILGLNLLEQQISELISNAIKHGNRMNINKKIKIWYLFDLNKFHLIVEDEGDGFKEIEKWNEFNKIRNELFQKKDVKKMERYVSYKTEKSSEEDGGNALFAAVEYWNGGLVFNEKRNAVAVLRILPIQKRGVKLE